MGCSFSFCLKENVPSRTQSTQINKTYLMLFDILKQVHCKELSPFFDMFRKFHNVERKFNIIYQITIPDLIKKHDCNFEDNSYAVDIPLPKQSTEKQIYELIRNHILQSKHSLIKNLIKAYNKFLSDTLKIPLSDELMDGLDNIVKCETSLSMSVSQISIIEPRTSTFNGYQTERTCKTASADYSYMHYHRPTLSEQNGRQTTLRLDKNPVTQVEIQLKKYPGLGTAIICQINELFKAIRILVINRYKKLLCEYFKNDEFLERELLLQRIIQSLLLSERYSIILNVLYPCIKQHYADVDTQNKATKNLRPSYTQTSDEPILDFSLFPKNDNNDINLFIESEEEDSSYKENDINQHAVFIDPIIEEEEDEKKILFSDITLNKQSLKREEVIKFIKHSEMITSGAKIPYQETFATIQRMSNSSKFCKIFNLIEKMDTMIIQIFLRSRSESQYMKLYDTIAAEDSKSEILFFILYKFQKMTGVSLQKLYLHLRFMHEFDGVLHEQIQYVFCPNFLRFYSILDMLMNSEV